MENKDEFNVVSYMIKMVIASIIWAIIVSIIISNISSLPQQTFKIDFNATDSFSFELSHLVAWILAIVSQYIILVHGGIFKYTFTTECKNPVFYLFMNILLGGFVALLLSGGVQYENIDAIFIAKAFVIIAIVNYFLFYARYGYEYKEKEFEEDWNKKVYNKSSNSEQIK